MTALAASGCGRQEPAPSPGDAISQSPAATVTHTLELPASVINAHVAALMWFDMNGFSPDAIKTTLDVLWPSMRESMSDLPLRLDRFDAFRTAFLAAGGEVIVVGVAGGESGEATRPFVLIRVAPGTEPATFQETIDAAMDVDATTTLSVYAPAAACGSHWLQVSGAQLADVPIDGDAVTAAPLLIPLQGEMAAPLRLALRLNEPARRLLRNFGRNIAPPILEPLQRLDTATVVITLGSSPRLTTRMQFTDTASAAAFNHVYQALIRRNSPGLSPASDGAIDHVFTQLLLHQEGSTLSLSLDDTFARTAPRLAPVLMPLILGMPDPSPAEPVTSAAP